MAIAYRLLLNPVRHSPCRLVRRSPPLRLRPRSRPRLVRRAKPHFAAEMWKVLGVGTPSLLGTTSLLLLRDVPGGTGEAPLPPHHSAMSEGRRPGGDGRASGRRHGARVGLMALGQVR
jgi:hypothetical protein